MGLPHVRATAPVAGQTARMRARRDGMRPRLRRPDRRGAVIAAGMVCLCGIAQGADEAPVNREYQLKAACLYQFSLFVEWPKSAFEDDEAPLRIGVLGESPILEALAEMVKGKQAGGRAVVVESVSDPARAGSCHCVFVARSERERLAGYVESLAGLPVLTVGETESFARDAGIIGFRIESNKVRFEINQGMAERAGLKISSHVLKLAETVYTAEREEQSR